MPLNLAYSFSRIQAFDCPRRFKLVYLEKKYEPSTVIATIGNYAHEVMKYYLSWLYENKRIINEKILNQSIVRVEFEWDKFGKWPTEFIDSEKSEVSAKVQDLFKESSFRLDPSVRKHWLEQKIAFDKDWKVLPSKAWFNKTGVYFRIILDWAYIPHDENTLWVVDHKSGWGEPDPGQLPYYAWGAFAGLGVHKVIDRVGIKFHWIAQNSRIDDMGFFDLKELKDVRDRIDSRVKDIESNTDWDPKAGPSCSYCGFTGDCPAVDFSWLETVEKKPPAPAFILDTQEKAEKGLELYILASARLNDLYKVLQAWVKERGPIEAAGKIFEQREKEQWLLTDPYGIQKALMNLGVHPTDLLQITGLSKSKLWEILCNKQLKRHYGDLVKKYGTLNKVTGDPKDYVAKKEVKR